jgi:DNA primase
VAGRIRDEDIAEVRERARIEEVVSQYVTLRRAGTAEKGLCPFHDEKTPSFQVRPSMGSYHCFGCGAGGDVFRFLMELEGMPFIEAVERLADKYNVQLRREESDSSTAPRDRNRRSRLVEANKAASEFYVEQLLSSPRRWPDASSSTSAGLTRTPPSGSRSASPRAAARRSCST